MSRGIRPWGCYNDGAESRREGLPITDCPPPWSSLASRYWRAGWRVEDARLPSLTESAAGIRADEERRREATG